MKKSILLLMLFACLRLAAQSMTGSWKGVLEVGPQRLTLVFHVNTGKQQVTMDVVEQGAKDVPMEVKHLTADSISVAMAKLGMVYAGRLKDGTIDGQFTQMGLSTALRLTPGAPAFARPQEPRAPLPYTTREVKFHSSAMATVLAGTLTYPVGHKQGDRVPVVLMVTGSGPQNRDEEVFNHKPFLVLADFLARHGIASLRYDDRGTAQSTGNFQTATTDDFARDTEAGLHFLKDAKEFSRVGILGHSEGGLIAFMLASKQQADFIVTLAAPACRMDTLMMVQLNGLARSQGAPADIVSSVDQARQMLTAKQSSPWMQHFLDIDAAPFVKAVKCPVLALVAEADLNVPHSLNTPALRQSLAGNDKATIKTYPGLSHLFHHNPSGAPTRSASIEETMSPEVLGDIAEWINGL